MVIHSAQRMPFELFDDFIELTPSNHYTISYSRIEKDLLGEGYDTNCKNYDINSTIWNQTIRSECIASCTVDKLSCPYETFLRREWFNDATRKFLNCQEFYTFVEIGNKRLECIENCPVDCLSTDFRIVNKEVKHYDDNDYSKPLDKVIFVTIKHSGIDEEVRHMPQINHMSLICNLGGLLGLWLGMSMLCVLKKSIGIINIIYINKTKQGKDRIFSPRYKQIGRRHFIFPQLKTQFYYICM